MIAIGDRPIDLAAIRAALAGPIRVELSTRARGLIVRSAETVARAAESAPRGVFDPP